MLVLGFKGDKGNKGIKVARVLGFQGATIKDAKGIKGAMVKISSQGQSVLKKSYKMHLDS